MAARILILGAGMVGSAAALDLRGDGADVTVADVSAERLAYAASIADVRTEQANLSRADAVSVLAAAHDLVIDALPSLLGFEALRAVITGGRPIVDVSFMKENALALDGLARACGVTAVIDCGIAPGLSHVMAGAAVAHLSPCERLSIFVGGLPVERRRPYEYKAGFSPADVVEEYVRPARVMEQGRVIVKEALSEPETIEIAGVGTLEAFLTDGLRTLCETLQVPFMVEKTLRYPGHRELMRALRDTGFFGTEPVVAGDACVRPLDVTAALLFPLWQFAAGEPDITILHVTAEGRRDGMPMRYRWELVDRYDPVTGLRSMSRTTAFSATAVARLVMRGLLGPGVHAPETLGVAGLLDQVLADLRARGVQCHLHVEQPLR